jgi:hypothetical protein
LTADGVWFQAYVDQILVPTLSPGDILVMHNLGSHKGTGVRKAIEAAGADAALSAALQPRRQPDREGVLEAPGAPAKAAERGVDAL